MDDGVHFPFPRQAPLHIGRTRYITCASTVYFTSSSIEIQGEKLVSGGNESLFDFSHFNPVRNIF